jgi:hypothetical protein
MEDTSDKAGLEAAEQATRDGAHSESETAQDRRPGAGLGQPITGAPVTSEE